MPYQLLDGGSFLHIRFFGVLESKDFRELFHDFRKYEENVSNIPNRMATLTDIEDFNIQFSSMFPIAQDRKKACFNPELKSAVVASRPIEKVVASMLQSMNLNETIHIRIFSSVAEAERWLQD